MNAARWLSSEVCGLEGGVCSGIPLPPRHGLDRGPQTNPGRPPAVGEGDRCERQVNAPAFTQQQPPPSPPSPARQPTAADPSAAIHQTNCCGMSQRSLPERKERPTPRPSRRRRPTLRARLSSAPPPKAVNGQQGPTEGNPTKSQTAAPVTHGGTSSAGRCRAASPGWARAGRKPGSRQGTVCCHTLTCRCRGSLRPASVEGVRSRRGEPPQSVAPWPARGNRTWGTVGTTPPAHGIRFRSIGSLRRSAPCTLSCGQALERARPREGPGMKQLPRAAAL